MAHVLRANGLSKIYRGKKAVDDLSLYLTTGEIVGLLGPNGAGKTTTFYMLVGMIRPDRGRIMFDDEDIGQLPMYKRALKGISYLPQEASIFRKLSVRDNLRAILEIKGLPREEMEDKVESLLDEFGLSGFADRHSYRLSGGERRRTEIARAIATDPTFILFDEPFAGIDPLAIIELKKMLQYLKEKGLGILLTDHNVRDALSITDRAYIINSGGILDEGIPDALIANPKVKETYLGEEFRL
ncbi:MAG TPA: LPS export ABC transporter ATP-binding protein [Thermodesulfovibrionales bacterium]|nr:LPS export ABC transporter ATP-binding protein [Thermodesulfovibrionales bacterium]